MERNETALGGMMRDVRLAFADLFSAGRLEPDQELTLEVLFGTLGALARADGLVSSEEAEFVNRLMDQLELATRGRQIATDAFDRGRRNQIDVDAQVGRFLVRFPKGSAEVARLYDSLVKLAVADRRLRPGERVFLDRVAAQLGYSAMQLEIKLKQLLPTLPTPKG